MYGNNCRVFDRYNKPVVSLAVLADDDLARRPTDFRSSLFGCEAGLRFPAVKLLDLAADEAALETSAHPFAQVVLAHLKAQQTHGDPAGRHVWKLRLVRGLYERGFSSKDVRELFRLIDWLMVLPPALNNMFWQGVEKIQEERRMPYVMSIERVGRSGGGAAHGHRIAVTGAVRPRRTQADARDSGDLRGREIAGDPQSFGNGGQPR